MVVCGYRVIFLLMCAVLVVATDRASAEPSAPVAVSGEGVTIGVLTPQTTRCSDFFPFRYLPPDLVGLPCVTVPRGEKKHPGTHGIPHMVVVSRDVIETPTSVSALAALPCLGKLRTRPSVEIPASSLSVGFETLDRRMFDPERTYTHLAALGVKWARVQTGWCRTEEEKGKYDFSWLDQVVDSLRRIGIQPWFSVSYGNRLYTPAAPDPSAVGWVPTFDPKPREAWTRYVAALANHFRGRVRHFEIWNEPNQGGSFWRPKKPNAREYAELVKVTSSVLREHVADAVIVGGAFAGMPTDFLSQALEAGLGDCVDKISFHPYRPVPEQGYAATVAAWRELLAKHNPEIRLWQGENGAPSEKGSSGALGNLAWTEEAQAKWVLRRILTDLSLGIELTSYFHTVDLVNYNWGRGPSGKTNYKGLLRGTEYTPKPSFFAYRNVCSLFDAETRLCESSVQVAVAGDEDGKAMSGAMSAVFARRKHAVAVYWHTDAPLRPFRSRDVDLSFGLPPDCGLRTPVLVDPLEGRVHHLPAPTHGEACVKLTSMPLLNHPLIVTDLSILDVEPMEEQE